MALEIKQNLKLSQQLVITPQLQQAIKLLQLSQPELVEMVEKELIENPLLEEDSLNNEPSKEANQDSKEDITNAENKSQENTEMKGDESDFNKKEVEIDWENYINSSGPGDYQQSMQGHDEEFPSYENTLANSTSLFDHLMWQMQMTDLMPKEIEIGTLILGAIGDDGYFREDLSEIAKKTNASFEEAEKVLHRIQEFDPPGIAARNLKECLLIQVKNFKDQKVLEEIIAGYLHFLERRDFLKIAKGLKISLEKVKRLAKIIYELEPKPGRQFSSNEAQYITPDVYVRKIGAEWVVFLNEDGLPKLKVNALYKSMMEQNVKEQTKSYVQDKLRSALWLIKSIHQRQRTLFKTAKTIVQFQQEFFDKGINYLKPMVLKDVANEIEMHESTISRVTTNKYMHTPHGIFELKYFFNSGIATGSGESIASESIKMKIKNLIAHENPKKPLSDQVIVKMLQSENIDIARRTIAKYRETLGILPSSKRRQFY
ncbi:MAG: RNA polymerase factor sigma-54 [Deltaproteobacteria bacterium]|nr:RNA polymerase factor sigma-54 [Deltaproteobacteria bacterium]